MRWGWKGSIDDFIKVQEQVWLDSLMRHHKDTSLERPSTLQLEAWTDTFQVLKGELQELVRIRPDSVDWTMIFEYSLPREGGRRPDLVILADSSLAVVEFKEKARIDQADVDQVATYARDLASYHEGTHGHTPLPILVPTRLNSGVPVTDGQVRVAGPSVLAETLSAIPSDEGRSIDPEQWVNSDYAPLPSLVEAARRIFNQEPLPTIKRAQSARIDETTAYLADVAKRAKERAERHLVLITGVPGAGKTLVGLKFVHEHHCIPTGSASSEAVFLSGNGPLVEVLQEALKSRVFVQPMRKFIREYGLRGTCPKEHVLVFDEAQRAWDAEHVSEKHHVHASEPDMLIEIGDRLPQWAMVVGLVGEGQEIHIGEEAGLAQWNQAISRSQNRWYVHGPSILRGVFPSGHFISEELLNLTTSLRTHLAADVQDWVRLLLDEGDLPACQQLASRMRRQGFCMYVTRELEQAKDYARERYMGQPQKRYGLLASSKAKNLPAFGVYNDFNTTKRLKVGKWYNDPPDERTSCCALESVVTEFACQGLELDLPVICWGDDLIWRDGQWKPRHPSRRDKARDPQKLRLNSYRVLLSRGRDGFVIFVPPTQDLSETYDALLRSGILELPK